MTSPPELPVTWRPKRGRWVPHGSAIVSLVGFAALAVLMPASFKLPDRIMMFLFGALLAWILYLLGRCRVVADVSGVTVVNAMRTHRYSWAEIIQVNMVRGDPWPRLDLADGSTIGAMGIQGGEPARAWQAVEEFKALIHKFGEAPDSR
ncbi:PH domain-containing protein [Rhizohabitans arisaemae]|uniref:PH domain-containing protein n=1 Tax=Rhizohabitans arisaemae TaxID=2720610 RepID=UPI0024B127B8|nr:PH domain-containing protein [Rhizohabitans arisaemae]